MRASTYLVWVRGSQITVKTEPIGRYSHAVYLLDPSNVPVHIGTLTGFRRKWVGELVRGGITIADSSAQDVCKNLVRIYVLGTGPLAVEVLPS